MKQTAAEWIIEQLRQLAFNKNTHLGLGDIRVSQGLLDDIHKQAKEMERQQIIDAHIEGQPFYSCQSEKAEQYYKQTYESTGAA